GLRQSLDKLAHLKGREGQLIPRNQWPGKGIDVAEDGDDRGRGGVRRRDVGGPAGRQALQLLREGGHHLGQGRLRLVGSRAGGLRNRDALAGLPRRTRGRRWLAELVEAGC